MTTAPGAEEDDFGQFLEQGPVVPVATPQADASELLAQLVACAMRQEQHLAKVCNLLAGLDDKVSRLTLAQESLEAAVVRLSEQQSAGVAAAAPAAGGQRPSVTRGSMVMPPGKTGSAAPALPAASPAVMSAAEQKLQVERMEAERRRMEEESHRRAEELARKREEDEQRKREEQERFRLEEERKKEEERQRKLQLEQKTNGLMSNLITASGGGLFGDDTPPKKSKGGLFDD